jgi:hypothetical protein
MTIVPQLPEELHEARDAVIESVHKDLEPPKSLESIHQWLETKGWDALTGSTANETMAVDLNQFASYSFSDEEYIAGWLDEERPITDAMRITHARMLISNASDGDDGYLVPSVYSVNIKSDNGNSAVVAAIMRMMGQGGPEITWWGVYKTHKDFLEDLKKAGLVPVECIKDITDTEVLAYWKKKKARKSRKMRSQDPKIRITINYGYDIHSLELLARDFERIKNGESLEIIGQGFSIEGEITQDTWLFKNKNISVDCENGFDVYKGSLDDILSIENI